MNRIRLAAIAIGVLTLGIVALAWTIAIAPMLAQVRDAEQLALTAKGELAAATRTLEALEASAANIGESRAALELLRLRIPEEPAGDELVDLLSVLAARHGVEIQTLTFSEPAAVSGAEVDEQLAARLFRLDLSLRATGTAGAVLAFVDDVQRDTRITLVHSIQLSPGEVTLLEFSGSALVLGPEDLPGVVDSAEVATPDGVESPTVVP